MQASVDQRELVNPFEADAALGRCLDPARPHGDARRELVRVISVAPEKWAPPKEALEAGGLGLLVLDGVLLRRVCVAERYSLEPLGPGDLVGPRERSAERSSVCAEVAWRALTPARLAVLDVAFTHTLAEFPAAIDELVGRISRRAAAQAVRLTILQQPRLSARLHFVLWQLADRFGQSNPNGVILPLLLSHELLAELVGAQRPPVSRALKELERQGLVSRLPRRAWWLDPRPPEGLAELVQPHQLVAA